MNLALLELKRARRSQLKIVLPDSSDRRLINLCQAVMAAPSLDIPFERHAEAAGASVRTLARLFKDGLGMGFAEWRRQVQLATAAAELIQGVPVSTIARELGYSPAASATCSAANWGWPRRNTRPEKPAPECLSSL